jgi:hypothetical protein
MRSEDKKGGLVHPPRRDERAQSETPKYEAPTMTSTSEAALLRELAPVHGITSDPPTEW